MHHAHIDKFAYQDSAVHRLDPRVKVIAVAVLSVFVLATGRYRVAVLALWAIWPFAVLVIGRIPLGFVLKHIAQVAPFAAVAALSCPYYNRAAVEAAFGPWRFGTTYGWLQFANIMCKFAVTMGALMALICTTKFADLLAGLRKMHVPAVLVNQLGFLYRYIFVLVDKAHHIMRARVGRTLRYLGLKREAAVAGAMIGTLLVTSIETSERVLMAMQARGFDGQMRTLTQLRITRRDWVFAAMTASFIAVIRLLGF
jgi:cobalt/nickel transport system permease protein